LTRIAEEHAKKKIPAGLYPCFGEVLVDVVLEKDRQAPFKADVLRRAWTSVIQPGIEYMRRKTEEVEARRFRGDFAQACDTGATVSLAARRRKAARSAAKVSGLQDVSLAGIPNAPPAIPGEHRRVRLPLVCPCDGTAAR
jgi:hypothetical protein